MSRLVFASVLLDGAFEPGFLVDESGVVLHQNDASCLFSGEQYYNASSSFENTISKDISSLLSFLKKDCSDDMTSWEQVVQSSSSSLHQELLCKATKANGEALVCKVRVTPLPDNDDRQEKLFCIFLHVHAEEVGGAAAGVEMVYGMLEASLDPILQIDDDGIIDMVNEAAVRQFGYQREQFVGRNIKMIVGGGHAESHDEYLKHYLETGEKRVIGKKRELSARRKDGTEFPIELSLAEFQHNGHQRFCGFIRDLTRQKKDEEELKRREALVHGMLEASLDPMLQIDEHGIIQLVNEAAVPQFGFEREEFVGRNIKMIVGGGHAESHDEYLKHYLETGEKRVIGKKRELSARRKDGTEFPIELSLAEFQHNGHQRFCGFIRDLTRQKQDEEELKRREALVHGMLEASLDPMLQIDEHGIIQLVNEAAVRQFGFEREEFVGRNIKMIVGGGHAESHDVYLKHYLKTGEKRVIGKKRELPARRKDGTEFPIELSLAEFQHSGRQHFCGFIRDVTRQKQDEEELKRREALVHGMLEASLDPMVQIDEHGIMQLVNEAAVRQFGFEREEFVGRNIKMIVGGGHAESHDAYLKHYLETGEKRVIGKKRELPARRKDGTEFPIELSLAEFQHNGRQRFCGFIRDLTRQKQDEEELKRREALVHGMLEASLDPMVQIDEHGIIQLVNEAAVRQFGFEREEFVGRNIKMIVGGGHAESHDAYLKHYLETGEKRVIGMKRELSAKRKDGTEFPVELGLGDVNCDGERRFCGFIRDMTRQKQDEQELKRREAFTNSIIEAAHDALFVTDGLEKIRRVNAAATRLFGWSREEFEAMTLEQLLAPKFAAEQRAELERYIKDNVPLTERREVTGVRKDGSFFPLLLGCSDVEGPTGQKLFALFSLDLSDQKRMVQIEIEKKAADVLLRNVLPDQIAEKLKLDPSHIAEHHDSATTLFADIVGFTAMSSTMEPRELVSLLNELFIMFDELVDKYDLNKIKTIGDCYMVSSVPIAEHKEHECVRVCHFALDMLDALARFNLQNPERQLNLRVGINEGPVVAGVVGTKRFMFDLWGDSVNLASRMESTGIPGKIQVTKVVADLAGDSFVFEARGLVKVKGKGEIEAFLLKKRLKEPRFSLRFLERQEQLRLERELLPRVLQPGPVHFRDSLYLSIADQTKTTWNFDLEDIGED